MTLTDKEKEHTLNEYLRCIAHLQDKEYQTRVWIRNRGPECQAFDDAVCDFFDIGDPILKEYRDFGITEAQYQVLLNLRNAFEAFSDEYDLPLEFINTSEWSKIMQMAKEVMDAFHYKKDPEAFQKAREKDLLFYRLIDVVFRLSSYRKENVWILKESNESDFTQMASFFLDKGKLILDNYKDYGLFDYHYRALKRFYDAFEAFLKAHSFDLEFTKTSEWEKVKAIAQDTLAVFHYTPKSHFDGYSEQPWV